MIRPLQVRAISAVAAVALCMSFASTSARAQSDTPRGDALQIESPELEKVRAPDFGPQTARATAEAARRYAEIAASGGWPRIAKPVGPDAKGKLVLELRRRLAAEDFLAREDANEPVWDAKLEDALKRFQLHTGLEQTGTVSRATLRELNAPALAAARGDGEATVEN
jgi:L,D-transpeptidase YcbB